MSYSIDANVLVYASDNQSKIQGKALAFLNGIPTRAGICYLCWPTVMAYLRISTSSKILKTPLSPVDAQANISRLIAHPKVRTLEEGESFWNSYLDIGATIPIRGNLVPDAHIAAILKQNGITTIYTRDTDFRRFDFLNVSDPFK